MTATVRIAPLEQWYECSHGRPVEEMARAVIGMEVQIICETMIQGPCGPRWRLTDESLERLNQKAGIQVQSNMACAHQLEMD